MKRDLLKDFFNPAGMAGPLQDSSFAEYVQLFIDMFICMTYLYGFSSFQVMKCIFKNDVARATAALERLLKERLIKWIASEKQQSGKLIKLTPIGADYAEAVLGQVRGRKYDSTSRLELESRIWHDLSSQLYVCGICADHREVRYLPEAAMEASRKNKYFDIIMMPTSDLIVGVEIERTSKYREELASTMGRAIRAIHAGDIDYVVFVLTTAEAAARYERVLDDECIIVSQKKGRRWIQDDVIDLAYDDLMRIICVVGNSEIWKGAM